MKIFILIFSLFSTSVFAASNQVQSWNKSPISNIRNQVASQNAGSFSEIPNSARTVSGVTANVDTGKVAGYIEDKTNYAGSMGKTYVATEIPYSAASAAKTWAKRFAKGGVASIVGSIVLDKFIDEVGWLIDEGGKVKKINDSAACLSASDAACSGFSTLYYAGNALQNGYFSSAKAAANASCNTWQWGGVASSNAAVYDGSGWSTQRFYCTKQDTMLDVTGAPNASYDSSNSQSAYRDVSQQDFQDAMNDYLNNNPKTQLAADLLTNAYTLQDPTGNPTSDPKKADPDVNDAPREIHDATNTVLKSNNPLSTGLTNTFPTVTYNNVTNNYNETSTTTNTDTTNNTSTTTTTTTTTDGQSESDIPPFCEYALTLCEWMDWTKESPDEEDEEEQQDVDDQGIFSRTFNTTFSLPASCPSDIPFVLDNPYLKVNDTISLKWLCIIFTFLGYPLVFVSHCIGIWILYEAVIRKEMKVS